MAQGGAAEVARSFHNRPGATLADLHAETVRCRMIAIGPDGAAVVERPLTPVPGPLPRATEPVLATIDGCLAMRGWRRYALSPRERTMLARLAPARRARTLARLVGAPRPAMGRLVQDAGGLLQPPAPH